MSQHIDLFDSTYGNFSTRVLNAIRAETFGEDIGQNSWTTRDEYDRIIPWLGLSPGQHVLEVASGSGGPARYLARAADCRVTGIDANEAGVAAARKIAEDAGDAERVTFQLADATAPLPFESSSFDGLVCIDSMNHFPDRLSVFREWCRVLRPGGRALFTDPVVISGPVTNEELAIRSSIGLFIFIPPEVTDRFVKEAGFRLVRREDVTANATLTAGRWHASREKYRDDLLKIEGKERYDGLQKFFAAVHRLTGERRLSRIAYLVEKPQS